MPRIIGVDDMHSLGTWVDGSNAIRSDMRGHTGGMMSLRHGIINHKCAKQKLNTKSSTETEIVATSDYILWTVWSKHFIKSQGYKLKKMSCIKSMKVR